MRILVEGSGGSSGWPEPGCRCASCRRQAAAGNTRGRSTIVVDDIVRIEVGNAGDTRGTWVRSASGEGAQSEEIGRAHV